MSSATVVVLLVGGLAYAAYAVPAMFQFFSYCKHVASATGRTEENADLKTQDDGAINAFQREQYRMLRSGEFMNGEDSDTVAFGVVVARRLRISFWAAVGLVASGVAADLWAK